MKVLLTIGTSYGDPYILELEEAVTVVNILEDAKMLMSEWDTTHRKTDYRIEDGRQIRLKEFEKELELDIAQAKALGVSYAEFKTGD